MADVGTFGEVGRELVSKIMTGSMIVFLVLILGGIIVGVAFGVRYYRQFNVKVRIKTRRGSGTDGKPVYKVFYTKGAIIYRKKDKRSFFRVLKERVDLPTPPFEALYILSDGGNEITIRKDSDTEYSYEIPGSTEKMIFSDDGETLEVAKQNVRIVGSSDAYWNVLRKRDNRKLFDMESLMMKLLPYIIPMLMVIMVIFLTYIISDHWGDFATAAKALKEAAEALRDVTTASTTTG